jgi:glutaredoxin
MAANADKKDNIKFLASMFHMEQSVCEQVLQENKDNVEDAVNHILTMLNEAKPQENSENNELNDQVKQFEKEKIQEKEKREKLLRQQQEAMRKYEEEREREKLQKEAEVQALMLKEKKLAEQKKKELEDLAREEELLALELQQGEEQRKAIEEKLRLAQQQNKELIEQRLKEEEEEMKRAQQKSMSDRPSGGRSGKRKSSKGESQNNKSIEPKEEKKIEEIVPELHATNNSKKTKVDASSGKSDQAEVSKSEPKVEAEKSEPKKEETPPKEEPKEPEPESDEPKHDVVQVEGAESDEFSLIPNDDELNSAQFGEELSLPLFSIYLRKSSLTKKNIDDTLAMKKLLTEAGVSEADVKEVDPSNDIELTGFIKAKCKGHLKFPILFIRDEMIGGLEDLQKMQQDGSLIERIARDKANQNASPRSNKVSQDDITESQQTTQEVSMGVLNTALEKAENVLSYLNPLNWFRGGKQTDKDDSVIEFSVIHTNWYWRQQTRVLRLTKEHVLRIHPKYGDVRAAQKYDDINKIVVKNKEYLIMYYKESSPDYFRVTSAAIEKIVSTIKERAQKPDEIPVEYVTK